MALTQKEIEKRQTERMKRLARLRGAVKGYIADEKKRIDTEVEVLTKIKESRPAGEGSAGGATAAASKETAASLAWYLRGF